MPKSRKRKTNRGPTQGPRIPTMSEVRRLAKSLDSREMRKLYLRQKKINPNLDTECDEMTKEIQEIFHELSSKK